ncbi:MAG: ferrochelatase, partial [Nitrospirae bacterium]|nr:ferrochelatase [Nitrospirota bacterium]
MTEHPPPSTAILLINLGGPDSLDSVRPFLCNLFSDPDIMGQNRLLLKPLAWFISRKRAPAVQKYYTLIGGKSPLLELTRRQGEALNKVLAPHGRFEVFVAMRYWHPMIEEVVKEILTSPVRQVIVLPLYPHYSATTTGSSLNEFNRVWQRLGADKIKVSPIREWYDHPTYIRAMGDTIQQCVDSHQLDIRGAHIVFSAHGIPLRFIEQGDPYARQIERSVGLIAGQLGLRENYHLCYQSRVGPLKWLGPSTEEVLKELGAKKVRDVVL